MVYPAAAAAVADADHRMIKRLCTDGLIGHEPYRHHRIVETFLVDELKMSPDRVHPEAHHLEHAVSDDVIERLYDLLGRTGADPHGSPISPNPNDGFADNPPLA